jgi:ribose-phosphate pyrophosphokinase
MIGATVSVISMLLAVSIYPQESVGFRLPSFKARSVRPLTMSASSDAAAKSWESYFGGKRETKYQVICGPALEEFAQSLVNLYPERFMLHQTSWGKFPDGTDNIEMGGFNPVNRISGENVLMLASFHNNDVTLSQFSVMVTLLQSFISSLTVVLPFYPVGTMERVTKEGQVATANTYAQMFSNLPSCGKPTRLIIYDLHTLQNRFYLHGNAVASLQTSIPMLIEELKRTNVDCIAFPDDGAAKRYGSMFKGLGFEIVTCGKTRDGDKRSVIIQDGNAKGKRIVIVDDLVQTGGTLFECGVALTNAGALEVNAFVAHGVFPNDSWKRFMKAGDRGCFNKFYLTNSIPTITNSLPKDDVFVVLDLAPKIVDDLDMYS